MTAHTTSRLFALPVWRDSPLFTDAERSALALAESATRMADHPDAVPDEVWEEAAEHFDERALASLVLMIALTNFLKGLFPAVPTVARCFSFQ